MHGAWEDFWISSDYDENEDDGILDITTHKDLSSVEVENCKFFEDGHCSEVFHVVDNSDCSLKEFFKVEENTGNSTDVINDDLDYDLVITSIF